MIFLFLFHIHPKCLSVFIVFNLSIDFFMLQALSNSESARLTCVEALYCNLSKIRFENQAYCFKQFSPTTYTEET